MVSSTVETMKSPLRAPPSHVSRILQGFRLYGLHCDNTRVKRDKQIIIHFIHVFIDNTKVRYIDVYLYLLLEYVVDLWWGVV